MDEFKPLTNNITSSKGFEDWVTQEINENIEAPPVEAQVEMIPESMLEKIKKEAYDTAYQNGVNAAKAEVETQQQQLSALISMILSPVSLVNEEVQEEVINLSVWLTKKILETELNFNANKLLAIFDEIKEILPSVRLIRKFYLNTDDYATLIHFIQEDLVDFPEDVIQIAPELSRGEYRLETENSTIDGTIEARMQELVLSTLSESPL